LSYWPLLSSLVGQKDEGRGQNLPALCSLPSALSASVPTSSPCAPCASGRTGSTCSARGARTTSCDSSSCCNSVAYIRGTRAR